MSWGLEQYRPDENAHPAACAQYSFEQLLNAHASLIYYNEQLSRECESLGEVVSFIMANKVRIQNICAFLDRVENDQDGASYLQIEEAESILASATRNKHQQDGDFIFSSPQLSDGGEPLTLADTINRLRIKMKELVKEIEAMKGQQKILRHSIKRTQSQIEIHRQTYEAKFDSFRNDVKKLIKCIPGAIPLLKEPLAIFSREPEEIDRAEFSLITTTLNQFEELQIQHENPPSSAPESDLSPKEDDQCNGIDEINHGR